MNKLFLLGIFLLFSACSSQKIKPQLFSTPESAINALSETVSNPNQDKSNKLFGSEGYYLLNSGDAVLDKKRAELFMQLFSQKHQLIEADQGELILQVGKKDWPFPVPLKNEGRGWFFDSKAGKEIVLSRRVGRNELSALKAIRRIYLAQRVYATSDADRDGKKEYAQNIISSPGTKNGLFWPTLEGEMPSPLDAAVAKAADENYVISEAGQPQPYRGYLYKIYKIADAAPESSDLLEKAGKYWLIAYPATWGNTGVMTFALNERGWIYEKNLEGKEQEINKSLPDIDQTWQRIE